MRFTKIISVIIFVFLASCRSEFQQQLASDAGAGQPDVLSVGEFGSANANKEGLPVDANIGVTLSTAPVASSINSDTLFITQEEKNASLGLAEFDFDPDLCDASKKVDATLLVEDVNITVDPVSNLQCATTYFICLTKEIKFANGAQFTGRTFNFTTAACNDSSIVFNDGATDVNTAKVNITVISANAAEYLITNEKNCIGELQWLKYDSSGTKVEWTLPGVDESVATSSYRSYVYAKFRDASGLESRCLEASVIFDNVAPTGSSVSLQGGGTTSPSANVVLKTLSTGADKMAVFANGTCTGTPSWVDYSETLNYQLTGTAGIAQQISVMFKDKAGNTTCVSESFTVSNPSYPSGVSVSVNGGTGHTNSAQINVAITATNATEYYVTNNAGCADGGNWQNYSSSPFSWTLSGIDANTPTNGTTKNFYFKLKNSDGSTSECIGVSVNYDNVAPTSSSASINAGATATNSLTASITLASTGAAQMFLANSASDCSNGTSWVDFATPVSSYTLTNTSGTATVYAKFKDLAGNATSCVSDSISYDAEAPTSPTVSIGGSSPRNTLTGASLTLSVSGATEMLIATNYDDCLYGTAWETYSTSKSGITLENNAGIASVFVKFRDTANNTTSCVESNQISYDATAPTGTSVSINSGATSIASNALTGSVLTIAATGASHMAISASSCNDASSWETYATSKTLSSTALVDVSGVATIYVKFKDTAGNITSDCATDTILVASANAPVVGSGLTFSNVASTTMDVTWGAATKSGSPTLEYQLVRSNSNNIGSVTNATANGTVVLSWAASTLTSSVTGLTASTNYYFTVLVREQGTTTDYAVYPVVAQATLDSVAPTIGSSMSLTAGSTTVGISWGAGSDNLDDASALLYKVVQGSTTASIDSAGEFASASVVLDWTANVTSTTASGLTVSTAYAFAVAVKDSSGNISYYTPGSTTTLGADVTAPTLSSGTISATATSNTITLSWTAASDGSGTPQSLLQYQVFDGISLTPLTDAPTIYLAAFDATDLTYGDANPINSATSALTSYVVAGLIPSTTYYFNVVVTDQAGNKVSYTALSKTTSPDSSVPTVGSGISVTPGLTSAAVSWGAGSDGGTLVNTLEYQLIRAGTTAEIDTIAEIDSLIASTPSAIVMEFSADTTSTVATGLTVGATYAYAVVLRDPAGNRALYSPVSATQLTDDTTQPVSGGSTNDDITAVAGTTTIDLSWNPSTDNATSSGMLLYRVVSGTVGTVNDALAATPMTDWTVNMTSVTLEELTVNTSYTFNVLVKDGKGNVNIYEPETVLTLNDVNPPTLGSGISATPSATSVSLSWGASTDDMTTAAKLQYKVVMISGSNCTSINTVNGADSETQIMIDWTANITSATVAELTKNTAYCFSVLVRDDAGNKSLYAAITSTTTNPTDGTAPTLPTDYTLTTVASVSSTGVPMITVSWNAASDAVTTASNLRYQLVRSTDEGRLDSVSKALSGIVVASWFGNSSAVLSAAATGLASGTTYAFNVIVKDTAGNMAIYTPSTETTDSTGAGVQNLTAMPNGETSVNFNINSLFGQKAGFFYQRSGETQPYYYQDMTGKKAGGGKYHHYLGKFSLSGVKQTSFGTNGWLSLKTMTGMPDLKINRASIHWQVCNNRVFALMNKGANSNLFSLYEATINATNLSASLKGDTVLAAGKVTDLACMNNTVYITGLNASNQPVVYTFVTGTNTFTNSGSTAITASTNTNYRAPFMSGSDIYFADWDTTNSDGYLRRLVSPFTSVAASTAIDDVHFPASSYPDGAIRNGIFGGFQTSTSDTTMYSGAGKTVKIWKDTAANLLTNFAANSTYTPTVSFTSTVVKKLKEGTILDGRVCRAAGKHLGFNNFKFYSNTHAHSGSFGGYGFFLANADGSRSSFYNRGTEITVRNKTFKDASKKSYISIACDESTNSIVLAYKVSKGHTTLIFMNLDPNSP